MSVVIHQTFLIRLVDDQSHLKSNEEVCHYTRMLFSFQLDYLAEKILRWHNRKPNSRGSENIDNNNINITTAPGRAR